MNVELICVGSELLAGDVVNTNAAHISKKLRELGHESTRQHIVDDNKTRLSELVSESLKRCDVLILTGGLGPTADDITKETVCETLGIPLTENAECRKHIDDFLKSYNYAPTENNYKQAIVPEGAKLFKNDLGTACGMCIKHKDKQIIMLPGPHKELVHMFDSYVFPYLKKLNHRSIVSHTLNVFGIGESLIETLIKPLCELENPVVATYCGNNECAVKITATADNEVEADKLCTSTMLRVKEILGDNVYGIDSMGMANEVVNSLRASGLKISTAESCTGGMLSQALTSVSHSSEVVEIGILAYSNRIKNEALSVPADVLEAYGAISPETAMYLAKNVRILSDSDIGVGITGNAGPSASENKPVGLVYVSIADKTKFFVKKLELPSHYDREKIRSYATLTALDLVRRYVAARPAAMPGMLSYDEGYLFETDKPVAEPILENITTESTFSEELPKAFDPNMNFIVFDAEEYDENGEVIAQTANINENSNDESVDINALSDKKHFIAVDKIIAFLNRIFPNKNDKNKERIIKFVSIIAVFALLMSSIVLVSKFAADNNQRTIIEKARENFEFEATNRNDETKVYSAFDQLLIKNPDIKGWISISNTNIDNPIYQTDNNNYYLNHNMNKAKSRYGALFFDFENKISVDGNSKNLTIYGHNMRDKSMFGSLNNYRSLKFYKNNPFINLKTLYNQDRYIIFAAMITNASPEDDNGYLYNFTKSNFASDEEFMAWINEAKERSLIDSGVTVNPGDEIITLSTSCYDFDNARFVVMAKKAVEGDSAVGAKLNSNVRYPQTWYDKKGLEGYKKPSQSDTQISTPSSSETNSSNQSETTDSSESGDAGNDFEDTSTSSQTATSSQTSSTDTSSENNSSTNTTSTTTSSTDSGSTSSNSSDTACVHEFNLQLPTDEYLHSRATCITAAKYYISCALCGEKSTETFEDGEPLGHTSDEKWHAGPVNHWHNCTVCKERIDLTRHKFDENGICKTCERKKETTE
jgi:nicotinamide-nucleotide amidase